MNKSVKKHQTLCGLSIDHGVMMICSLNICVWLMICALRNGTKCMGLNHEQA